MAGSSKVLLSGASGLIGTALVSSLQANGWKAFRLVRGSAAGGSQIAWNPSRPLDPESVSGFEAVIHLAGEAVFGRWTKEKKERVRDSRVLGTRHLAEALAGTSNPPRVFVSASATGYYGNRGDEILRESSAPGTGFLPEVCQAWEAAAEPAVSAGIRVVHPRIGLVLSASGGALAPMLTPFRLGLGGRIGNGRQWWSWIDIHDLVDGFLHLLRAESVSGPVNFVSPNPVTNAEFTKVLASVLSRPAIFPVPAFAIRLALGQMGEELLLGSQRVEPARLLASGYQFHSLRLKEALARILER